MISWIEGFPAKTGLPNNFFPEPCVGEHMRLTQMLIPNEGSDQGIDLVIRCCCEKGSEAGVLSGSGFRV